MDWLAAALELLAIWIVGNKNRWGWLLGCAGCLCWMVVSYRTGVHGLLLVAIPAFLTDIRNFVKWSRESTIK